MSKTWYPVVDYEKCTECGACIEKCSHGVYAGGPRPVVVSPDGCIHGCQGCGNLCPAEAITYFGSRDATCSCNCSCQ